MSVCMHIRGHTHLCTHIFKSLKKPKNVNAADINKYVKSLTSLNLTERIPIIF